MRFAAKFERLMFRTDGRAEVTFSTDNRAEVEKLVGDGSAAGLVDDLLDVKIEPHREKRTYDANAYFWKLAGELAKKLSQRGDKPISAVEIYRQYIVDYGKFTVLPVRNDLVFMFCREWEKRGMGWLAIEQGASKINGYTNVCVYFGSSSYNKEEMGRLIDAVVADCKEQGIDTRTPDEIADMLSLMEE